MPNNEKFVFQNSLEAPKVNKYHLVKSAEAPIGDNFKANKCRPRPTVNLAYTFSLFVLFYFENTS